MGLPLWIAFYNGLLIVRIPVDDLAVVGTARDSRTLQRRANHQTLCKEHDWLEYKSMKVAVGKTEAIMLCEGKKHP